MTLLEEKLAQDALMQPAYEAAARTEAHDANQTAQHLRDDIQRAICVRLAPYCTDKQIADAIDSACVALSDCLEETHRPIALGVLGADVEG